MKKINNVLLDYYKKDAKYYDLDKKELKNLLKIMPPNLNKSLLDVGAGIGRLAKTLNDSFKVTAIEKNTNLYAQIPANIKKNNVDILAYYPDLKFDYVLISWPNFNEVKKIFLHISKNILKKDGSILFLMPVSNDFNILGEKIYNKKLNQGINNFLDTIKDNFKISVNRVFGTKWVVPNLVELCNLLEFEYGFKIKSSELIILKEIIKEYSCKQGYILTAKINIISAKLIT